MDCDCDTPFEDGTVLDGGGITNMLLLLPGNSLMLLASVAWVVMGGKSPGCEQFDWSVKSCEICPSYGVSSGTNALVTPDGRVSTAASGVSGEIKLGIGTPSTSVEGTVVGSDR